MGQGDPLLQATLEYGMLVASGRSKSTRMNKEIHLVDTGSLFGGVGLKDVVHISKNEVLEFPCLPVLTKPEVSDHEKDEKRLGGRNRRVKQCSTPNMADWQKYPNVCGDENQHPVDHLLEHDTTFAGLGVNDIVHVNKDTVISFPCVPIELIDQVQDAKRRSEPQPKRRHSLPHLGQLDHLEDHGSPLAGFGMSDVIHFLTGKDQVVVSIPVLPSE
jgi:hypothetical protein